ncbi:hypothetical protein MN116_001549 [Schistosoma mekongi]|uniref:BZIP domain-containing protein n=1 Tax=Schistosoma mekongi TaxID=38744 RepID=A0AAE1ZJA7_SCHME|nr:hypothetical protein MN116_001549 [Schistosoma mekongi]
MDKNQITDDSPNSELNSVKTTTAPRPTTLNILLDNTIKSPALSSFLTPSLEELQPILRSEVEKILQHLKASPQTPGSFLNPKHVTEEQERFANVFTQKLNELRDASSLASLTAALSPVTSAVNNSALYNINLTDINSQSIPNFAELCRQASQGGINTTPPSILFYSPACFDTQSFPSVQAVTPGLVAFQSHQPESVNPTSEQNITLTNLQNSLSISLPNAIHPATDSEVATVQLPNGLRLGITTSGASQASILQMLGIESQSELGHHAQIQNQPLDPSLWPLNIQTNLPPDNSESHRTVSASSPRDPDDARPSSVDINLEQADRMPNIRSSSVSSVSSSSQGNSSKNILGSNLKDTRLDPTEQSRMRLERKRARNRDAARKCRERKIRLIKSLEKDVIHLSEENKALRNRLSRSRVEVERLKMFVVNHLDKDCPALSGKVA